MMGLKHLSSFLDIQQSGGWGGAPRGGGLSAKSWKTRGTSHVKIEWECVGVGGESAGTGSSGCKGKNKFGVLEKQEEGQEQSG